MGILSEERRRAGWLMNLTGPFTGDV